MLKAAASSNDKLSEGSASTFYASKYCAISDPRTKAGEFQPGTGSVRLNIFETIQLKSICCCPIQNKQAMKM